MLLEEEYLVVDTYGCSYRNDDPEAHVSDQDYFNLSLHTLELGSKYWSLAQFIWQ